jgi:hypothetical protein
MRCPECSATMRKSAVRALARCDACGKIAPYAPEPSTTTGLCQMPSHEAFEADPDDMVIPDYTEVMIGWRAWRTKERDGKIFLHSVTKANHSWPHRKPLIATCLTTLRARRVHPHPVPSVDYCTCGIYSTKTRAHLMSMSYPEQGQVIGEVSLWGRIVEGTHGWRAQFAYPRTLYVNYPSDNVVRLNEAYGVPVKVTAW